MDGRSFVAARRIKFGTGFLEVGSPVPIEPGRNYDQMLKHGDIVEMRAPDEGRVAELEDKLAEAEHDRDAALARVAELEAAAKPGRRPRAKADE